MPGRFSIEAIFAARDHASRTVNRMSGRMRGALRKASGGVTNVNRRFSMMNRTIKNLSLTALGAFGGAGAFGVLTKNVIDTGTAFEEQMSAVGAVMMKTRGEIGALEEKAKELGATTKFTGAEAAAGMELMARAGFSTQEILDGVGGVLDAAAASGLEMAEVAGHVSNVLKGMGLEASDATRVADVLALASSRTNSSIGSLGESMKNVAATAKQFNIPLEETVASVALLQDVGLDASVAGSALNTMLTKLAKPSSAVKQQMKEMGVAFQDSQGQMLPLSEVFENISKAAKKSGGNMDTAAFLADLVGLRGQKAAANMKDLFESGKFGELVEELRTAEGAAKKMAELKLDNIRGEWTLLQSAIDGVKIKLFETKSGPLRDLVSGWREWVELNGDLVVDKVQRFVFAVIELADVFSDAFVANLKATRGIMGKLFANESQVESALNRRVQFAEVLGKIMGTVVALAPVYLAMQVATFAWGLATKGAAIATATYHGILKAVRIATIAYNAVTKGAWFITSLYKGTIVAVNVASRAAAAGQAIMRTATAASAATAAFATTTFGALAIAVGAVTAAVLALVAAWDQNNKLMKETEGLGIFDILGGMIEQGTINPFEVVDAHQNKLAKERAAERASAEPLAKAGQGAESVPRQAQMEQLFGMGPGGFTDPTTGEPVGVKLDPEVVSQLSATADGLKTATSELRKGEKMEITIRDESGRSEVTQGPRGGQTSLRLQKSGTF